MALKLDEDFLRFLTIGAAGTASSLHSLNKRHGHRVVELERYATANKIWETKIKRLRLADLLCLDCGARVEVRTKSDLAIRMSHSDTTGREWDAGLRDDDLIAFVAWQAERGAVADHQELFRVSALRAARKHAKLGSRKAPSEGAERDITWPARVPKRAGRVETVDETAGTVRYVPETSRAYTYRLPKGVPAHIYVEEGQRLHGREAFLLGCVQAPDSVDCPGRTWSFADDLGSHDPIARYVGVKAAGIDGSGSNLENQLVALTQDKGEDERIRLEAQGSLARIAPAEHTSALAQYASTHLEDKQRPMAMESVFILSELGSPEAILALATIAANTDLGSEIRSAAVWGLGTAGADAPEAVLLFIADQDPEVALHSIAGIGTLDDDGLAALRMLLEDGTDREAASAAALLKHEGEPGIQILLEVAQADSRPAFWARSALGEIPETAVREASGEAIETQLATAISPMWIRAESWLSQHSSESPLEFLQRQTIRHLG